MVRAGGRWSDISVVLTDDAGITKINRDFLRHNRATDVISFTYSPGPGEAAPSGELFVNVERAVQRGTKRWPAARELALYLAHGCDHVSGATDDTPRQGARMRRRELRWLREAVKERVPLNLM